MRLRSAFVLCGIILALAVSARADGADDQYVRIYNMIQQADALAENHQAPAAAGKYAEAQTALTRFQSSHPDWNPVVVKFRLNYLASKIEEITAKTAPPVAVATAAPKTNAPPPILPPALPVVAAPVTVTIVKPLEPLPVPDKSVEIIKGLQEQLQQLSGDKSSLETSRALLEAKLKEALAAQPAAVDPRELTKAQQDIRNLLKENELLKVSLEQSKTRHPQADAAALEDLRRQLSDAKKATAALAAVNAALVAENASMRAKGVGKILPADAGSDALRQENEILKKQVADLKGRNGAKSSDVDRQLAAAQAQIAAMQSDREMLELEKMALENRVKLMGVAGAAVMIDATNAARIKELERQRDDLQKKLDAATIEIAGRKSADKPARVEELNGQLAVLRSRIEVLEARPLPYTPEELALLSKPAGPTMLVASFRSPPRRSPNELPANGPTLLAEAKRHYSAGELDKAELNYQDLAKLDPTNIGTLTDLASIQVEMNHPEDAEKSIQAALAIDANNEYSLFVLGRVRFIEQKYDDALEAFSRAAAANPQRAETQNYIGITLSEKGLRVPAEAALRKAIQIDPKYGSAQANLAFIYATEDPPRTELARWHYEKALAAGHPRNPGLEKRLNYVKPPATEK